MDDVSINPLEEEGCWNSLLPIWIPLLHWLPYRRGLRMFFRTGGRSWSGRGPLLGNGRTTRGPICASSHTEERSISADMLVQHRSRNSQQLTWFWLGVASPLVLCLLKSSRAKRAWSAGFSVAGPTVALAAGTQVVVAVGRLPPERVISQSPEWACEQAFNTALTGRSQTCRPSVAPLDRWLEQRSADR